MPHSGGGGGGGGGGFHSSGSGTHSSAPRYDHNGNLHSTYYIRPGFYINRVYFPYDAKTRKRSAYGVSIFLLILGLIFSVIGFFAFFDTGRYDEEKLEDYAIHAYSLVYDKKAKNYEDNILVTIIAYENNKEFDYISIVGDNLNREVDLAFGNEYTLFGGQVANNVPSSNYYENLYSYLAISINAIVDKMPVNCLEENAQVMSIQNITEFGPINGITELLAAELNFFNRTGYHISVYIATAKQAYPADKIAACFIWGMSVILLGFGGWSLFNRRQLLSKLNKAIENGEEAQYFEGEDDYETHRKSFPAGLK